MQRQALIITGVLALVVRIAPARAESVQADAPPSAPVDTSHSAPAAPASEGSASMPSPARQAGASEPAAPGPDIAGVSAGETAVARVLVDRVVVRFTSPETGGVASPRFIFERELAFEARLEASVDASFTPSPDAPYLDRHVRAALERHMAETLLQSLEITPEPTPADLELRMRSARLGLREQMGGDAALQRAREAEGIAPNELERLLERRARASLYLDRMVVTMLTPSDTELRVVHRTTRTPFSAQPYEAIAPLLQRWYVAQRLNAAVRAFYDGARSRIKVTLTASAIPHP